MDDDYKATRFYKWARRCFWILMLIYLPIYFISRYQNSDEREDPAFRLFDSLGPIPTHMVKWETYVMTPPQVAAFLENEKSPKQILRDRSLPSKDPNGDYYILFRFKSKDLHFYGGLVKFYPKGIEFPLECQVYPGKSDFKDYFIPFHVDPKKIKTPSPVVVRWRTIFRK